MYIGGLDNDVHVFSLTSHSVTYSLRSHADTVTSLSLSPNSQQLLSVGADSVLNLWNVQPFAPTVNGGVEAAVGEDMFVLVVEASEKGERGRSVCDSFARWLETAR